MVQHLIHLWLPLRRYLGAIVSRKACRARTLATIQKAHAVVIAVSRTCRNISSRRSRASHNDGISGAITDDCQLPSCCHAHDLGLEVCRGLSAPQRQNMSAPQRLRGVGLLIRGRESYIDTKNVQKRVSRWEGLLGRNQDGLSARGNCPDLDWWQGKGTGGDSDGVELDAGGAGGKPSVVELDDIGQCLL